MRSNTDLVKEHWSKTDHSVSERNFYGFPAIRTRSCKLIFNESDARKSDWGVYWTIEKYLKDRIPFEKCLSICCGFGEIERCLAKLNVAKRIVGSDIAEGAIEEARKRAEAENLNNIGYYVSDLQREEIPQHEYDLIWANGALHHIAALEIVVPMLYNALRPGGYLVSNEYVGPRYQQIGSRQRELVNAVKHLLPPLLRTRDVFPWPYGRSIVARGIRYLRRKLERMICGGPYGRLWDLRPVEYFLTTDPSECINSDMIIPTLEQHFDDVELRYYNGSILFYALDSEFFSHFDPSDNSHCMILEMLFHIEDVLAAVGEMGQDHAHIICRKGTAGRTPNKSVNAA